ncbi:MAG: DUF6600 domain-containing protein [Beijerinckiaceae bacterium]
MPTSAFHASRRLKGATALVGVALALGAPGHALAQQPAAVPAAAAQPAAPAEAAPAPDQGQSDVRALLANYGTFVSHDRYGEVWRPTVTPQGWRPYEPCNWVFTKKFGWYYQDPTPWGQIVHHFGRWTNDPQMGWIWVPGDQFSPAWVIWRTSNDYIGWAPTPPDEDIRTVSAEQFTKPEAWTFVAAAKFGKSCQGAMPAPVQYAPQPAAAYAPIVAPAPQIPALLGSTVFVETVGYVDGIAYFILPPLFVGPFFDLDPWLDPWLGPWVPPLFGPWSPGFLNFFANELNWLFAAINFGPPIPAPIPGPFPPGSPCNLPGVVCVPYSKKISPQQKHPMPSLVVPPALVAKPLPAPPVHAPPVVLPPATPPGPPVLVVPPGPPPVVVVPPRPPVVNVPPRTPPVVTLPPNVTPPRVPIAQNPAYRPPLRPLPATVTPHVPVNQFHGIVQTNTPRPVVRTYAPQAAQSFPARTAPVQVQPRVAQPVQVQPRAAGPHPAWPVVR